MPDQHIMDKEEIIGSDMSDTEVYTTNQTVGSGADEEFGEPDSSLDAESIGSTDMADNLLIDEDDEMSQESVEVELKSLFCSLCHVKLQCYVVR